MSGDIEKREREVQRLESKLKLRREELKQARGDVFDRKRPRGVFTEAYREWLLGSDVSRRVNYNRRTTISERLNHSVLDLAMLSAIWSNVDIEVAVEGQTIDGAMSFLQMLSQEVVDDAE